ncbi:MAG TPA: hypothetical protein VIX91_10670 [Candidatus Acidoferrum sp.]
MQKKRRNRSTPIKSGRELVGGAGGGIGEFFVFADYGDKGLSGAREAAVAAVDETEFTPEIDAFPGLSDILVSVPTPVNRDLDP